MTPAVPAVLFELAALLGRNAQPDVPPAERAGDLGLAAALLAFAGEVWDRQAAVLIEENRAVRALLGATGEETDFRISALEAENARLKDLLIQAHAAAEAAGDMARQDAIWAELAASTERRRLSSAPV